MQGSLWAYISYIMY
ncbi:hypothetical protein KIPB_017384, partial [Kipferlia bialata]|eukprot:g17384.t1